MPTSAERFDFIREHLDAMHFYGEDVVGSRESTFRRICGDGYASVDR